jgi:hypothetical protein
MTHFYYSTGRTDKSIKNKLFISESLVKELESICINNSYYDTDRVIIIKSFNDEFRFKSISELVEALKK